VVLALAVGGGALVSQVEVLPAVLLLPFHVVTMALPPLVLLAITGSALRGPRESWRTIVAGLGGAGLLGMPVTMIVEAALVLSVGVLAGATIMVVPGGADRVAGLVEQLQDPRLLSDTQRLLELALDPLLLLGIVGLASFAAPLAEEVLKPLAAVIGGAVARPDPARAFVWGVASGAGFAIVENLFNGSVAGQATWLSIAISRVAATTLHCFTGGLVGWAWGQLWSGGRLRRFFAGLAGATFLHGSWNLIAIGMALAPAAAEVYGDRAAATFVAGVVPVAGLVLLATLGLALAVALPLVARHLSADRSHAALEAGGDT
jgi:hypothetical protein